MSATLNIAGLLMNLVGVILLFRYGMPYRVRTGGNELRFTGATDQDTANAEQLYGRLGVTGLVLIVLGTAAQVIATVWPVKTSPITLDTVRKITIEVICAAVVIHILFRENFEKWRDLEARLVLLVRTLGSRSARVIRSVGSRVAFLSPAPSRSWLPRIKAVAMPRDRAIIFADLLGKLIVLRIECDKCGWSGSYRLAQLIARYGRNEKVFTWIEIACSWLPFGSTGYHTGRDQQERREHCDQEQNLE